MANYAVLLDVETTGFNPTTDAITEVAAVRFDLDTFEIVAQFERLVRITCPVPSRITMLTGITPKLLKHRGLPLRQVMQELVSFCGPCPIYAHNAPFDKQFVRVALQNTQVPYVATTWINTINIIKQRVPGRRSYSLEALVADYKVGTQSHRALSDVLQTLKLLQIVK